MTVDDLAPGCSDAVRPAARAAQNDVGVNLQPRKRGSQEGGSQTVVSPQRLEPIERERADVGASKLREGLIWRIQRRVERRIGKRPEHREDHPLRSATLREIVMHERHPRQFAPAPSSSR